jgi:hypothetical protein
VDHQLPMRRVDGLADLLEQAQRDAASEGRWVAAQTSR